MLIVDVEWGWEVEEVVVGDVEIFFKMGVVFGKNRFDGMVVLCIDVCVFCCFESFLRFMFFYWDRGLVFLLIVD